MRDLIGRMTLKEKIGQMAMPGKSFVTLEALRDGSIGIGFSSRFTFELVFTQSYADAPQT